MYVYICDRALENRPCERKLHQIIFSPIRIFRFVLIPYPISVTCRRKPIKFCIRNEDFVAVV